MFEPGTDLGSGALVLPFSVFCPETQAPLNGAYFPWRGAGLGA